MQPPPMQTQLPLAVIILLVSFSWPFTWGLSVTDGSLLKYFCPAVNALLAVLHLRGSLEFKTFFTLL